MEDSALSVSVKERLPSRRTTDGSAGSSKEARKATANKNGPKSGWKSFFRIFKKSKNNQMKSNPPEITINDARKGKNGSEVFLHDIEDDLAMAISLPEEVKGRAVQVSIELKAIGSQDCSGSETGLKVAEETQSKTTFSGNIKIPSDTTIEQVANMPLYFVNPEKSLSAKGELSNKVETVVKPLEDNMPINIDKSIIVSNISLKVNLQKSEDWRCKEGQLDYTFISNGDRSLKSLRSTKSLKSSETSLRSKTDDIVEEISQTNMYNEHSKMIVKDILSHVMEKVETHNMSTQHTALLDCVNKEIDVQKSLLLGERRSSNSLSRISEERNFSGESVYPCTTTTTKLSSLSVTTSEGSMYYLKPPTNTPKSVLPPRYMIMFDARECERKNKKLPEDIKADIDKTLELLETAKNKLLNYLDNAIDLVDFTRDYKYKYPKMSPPGALLEELKRKPASPPRRSTKNLGDIDGRFFLAADNGEQPAPDEPQRIPKLNTIQNLYNHEADESARPLKMTFCDIDELQIKFKLEDIDALKTQLDGDLKLDINIESACEQDDNKTVENTTEIPKNDQKSECNCAQTDKSELQKTGYVLKNQSDVQLLDVKNNAESVKISFKFSHQMRETPSNIETLSTNTASNDQSLDTLCASKTEQPKINENPELELNNATNLTEQLTTNTSSEQLNSDDVKVVVEVTHQINYNVKNPAENGTINTDDGVTENQSLEQLSADVAVNNEAVEGKTSAEQLRISVQLTHQFKEKSSTDKLIPSEKPDAELDKEETRNEQNVIGSAEDAKQEHVCDNLKNDIEEKLKNRYSANSEAKHLSFDLIGDDINYMIHELLSESDKIKEIVRESVEGEAKPAEPEEGIVFSMDVNINVKGLISEILERVFTGANVDGDAPSKTAPTAKKKTICVNYCLMNRENYTTEGFLNQLEYIEKNLQRLESKNKKHAENVDEKTIFVDKDKAEKKPENSCSDTKRQKALVAYRPQRYGSCPRISARRLTASRRTPWLHSEDNLVQHLERGTCFLKNICTEICSSNYAVEQEHPQHSNETAEDGNDQTGNDTQVVQEYYANHQVLNYSHDQELNSANSQVLNDANNEELNDTNDDDLSEITSLSSNGNNKENELTRNENVMNNVDKRPSLKDITNQPIRIDSPNEHHLKLMAFQTPVRSSSDTSSNYSIHKPVEASSFGKTSYNDMFQPEDTEKGRCFDILRKKRNSLDLNDDMKSDAPFYGMWEKEYRRKMRYEKNARERGVYPPPIDEYSNEFVEIFLNQLINDDDSCNSSMYSSRTSSKCEDFEVSHEHMRTAENFVKEINNAARFSAGSLSGSASKESRNKFSVEIETLNKELMKDLNALKLFVEGMDSEDDDLANGGADGEKKEELTTYGKEEFKKEFVALMKTLSSESLIGITKEIMPQVCHKNAEVMGNVGSGCADNKLNGTCDDVNNISNIVERNDFQNSNPTISNRDSPKEDEVHVERIERADRKAGKPRNGTRDGLERKTSKSRTEDGNAKNRMGQTVAKKNDEIKLEETISNNSVRNKLERTKSSKLEQSKSKKDFHNRPEQTKSNRNVKGKLEPTISNKHVENKSEQSLSNKHVKKKLEQTISNKHVNHKPQQTISNRNIKNTPEQTASNKNVRNKAEQPVSNQHSEQTISHRNVKNKLEQTISNQHVETKSEQTISNKNARNNAGQAVCNRNVENNPEQALSNKHCGNILGQTISNKSVDNNAEQAISNKNAANNSGQTISNKNVENKPEQIASNQHGEDNSGQTVQNQHVENIPGQTGQDSSNNNVEPGNPPNELFLLRKAAKLLQKMEAAESEDIGASQEEIVTNVEDTRHSARRKREKLVVYSSSSSEEEVQPKAVAANPTAAVSNKASFRSDHKKSVVRIVDKDRTIVDNDRTIAGLNIITVKSQGLIKGLSRRCVRESDSFILSESSLAQSSSIYDADQEVSMYALPNFRYEYESRQELNDAGEVDFIERNAADNLRLNPDEREEFPFNAPVMVESFESVATTVSLDSELSDIYDLGTAK